MWFLLPALAMATEIVLPGTSDDETAVASVVDGDRWLSLEQTAAGWRLREAPIHLVRRAPTSPHDATAMYFDVGVDPADGAAPLLFLRGKGLRSGPVMASAELPTFGDATFWTAPDGAVASVGIYGTVEPHPAGYADGVFRDMTITVAVGHGEPGQVVLGPVSHHESPPSVSWMGDLDGDGRVDLITRVPLAGGGSETSLWLSSAAARGHSVGLAAKSTNQGC